MVSSDPTACGSCPISPVCGRKGPGVSLRGGRLGGAAVLCFLVPLIFALIGAIGGRGAAGGELFGSLLGLVTGGALVKLIVGWCDSVEER